MTPYRPPYRGAAVASAAAFALYVLTLAPTTAFWDASEYIATAHILGIPHPPGNPLFVVLARTWEVLLSPFGLPVAVRINLFAAATSAVAAGFFFLVAHRILADWIPEERVRLIGAGLSVLLGATAYTVWNQSTVNEKVYTVSVMVIAIVTWLALRWRDRKDEPAGLRYLLLAVYLMVLGMANHLMSALPLPALGLFVLLVAPTVLLSKRFWVRAIPLVVLGLSFNFFLPIRAADNPVINEGHPTCESPVGAATAVFTLGRAGCPALAANLTRQQYMKPPLTERQAPFADQLWNYVQYFDWQWARGLSTEWVPGNGRLPFTILFFGLGLGGLWVAWRADRDVFAYLVVLTTTLTVGLVFYLNFRYGYSLAPGITDQQLHEVRERDYFFVASFMVWGMLAGLGLTGVWRWTAERTGASRAWLTASPVLVVALVPLVTNWEWAGRSGDWAARDWAYDLLMSVEPYGVLFTNGDNDTFPLWYVQEVEGIRKDVTVVVVQYLYTDWYPRQLQALTRPDRQRRFDPALENSPYAGPEELPAGPVLRADPEVLDRVAGGPIGQDFTVPLGEIAVSYPAGTYLDRGQRLALSIIHDTIGERSVYFASTTGLMGNLGLDPWGVRQGLATRLTMQDPETVEDPSWVKIAPSLGGDWFDVDRSLHLVLEVYRYRGLEDREVWADRATLNIPYHFYVLFVQLADAAQKAGRDPAVVEELIERAEGFLEAARGGRVVAAGAE